MCSVSTDEKSSKKRKTEHLEQTENQNDSQSYANNQTESENTSRTTKRQMTCVPPTTDSISNLLVQGLQSSDDALVNDVLNRKESVVESTINNLPNVYVEQLFNFLQRALYEQGENVHYVIGLRKLFQFKISHILNIPNIRNNLKMLSDTLDLRCDLLDRCYKLKGRLDLMFLMLNKDDRPLNEENIVIYEESSSEGEQPSDNEDDLIGLMQSDDDENDNKLNEDLLDEEDQFEIQENGKTNSNDDMEEDD